MRKESKIMNKRESDIEIEREEKLKIGEIGKDKERERQKTLNI
jgi:hypothetical protein